MVFYAIYGTYTMVDSICMLMKRKSWEIVEDSCTMAGKGQEVVAKWE